MAMDLKTSDGKNLSWNKDDIQRTALCKLSCVRGSQIRFEYSHSCLPHKALCFYQENQWKQLPCAGMDFITVCSRGQANCRNTQRSYLASNGMMIMLPLLWLGNIFQDKINLWTDVRDLTCLSAPLSLHATNNLTVSPMFASWSSHLVISRYLLLSHRCEEDAAKENKTSALTLANVRVPSRNNCCGKAGRTPLSQRLVYRQLA